MAGWKSDECVILIIHVSIKNHASEPTASSAMYLLEQGANI